MKRAVALLLGIIGLGLVTLVGCSSGGESELTPEQQAAIQQLQQQFDSMKAQVDQLKDQLADAGEKASDEAKKAFESAQNAVEQAQAQIESLEDAGQEMWEQKRAEVDKALKDLASKYADAIAKLKAGEGLKLPGF
jgi:outer membrane murein-binding lipoprotein Lpp